MGVTYESKQKIKGFLLFSKCDQSRATETVRVLLRQQSCETDRGLQTIFNINKRNDLYELVISYALTTFYMMPRYDT